MTRTREDVGTFDQIRDAAVRTTGLADFGGDAHEEALRLLVDDLRTEARLTPEGSYLMRTQVKSALVGRLLAEHGFSEHPTYADVGIERPIFVVGLPRTGTTALHRLLTADPRHQGLELWLTEVPMPRPPRADWTENAIFNALQAAYAEHYVASPEFMGIHYMDAASVEECWRLLRQAGKSISYESLAFVPNYSAWLAGQDWTDAYARHRQNLQLIGLNDQHKRWVLKNPSHLAGLDAIMSVYPDALIVQTHRDPVTCIASSCSLSAETTSTWSTKYTGAVIGETQLDLWARSLERFDRERPAYAPEQFVDVDYRDFVADPVGTTRGIYDAFGLDWTAETDAAVTAIDGASRHGGRRPAHAYSLDDYGLTAEQVRDRFR